MRRGIKIVPLDYSCYSPPSFPKNFKHTLCTFSNHITRLPMNLRRQKKNCLRSIRLSLEIRIAFLLERLADHSHPHDPIYSITRHRLFVRSRAPHDPFANRFPRCSRVRHRIALFRSGFARSHPTLFFSILFFLPSHRLERTETEHAC